MKKTLMMAAAISYSLMSGALHADTIAYVAMVSPNYSTQYVEVNHPHCYQRQVLTHSNLDRSDAISGAIIGGLIGSQFGSGSGKEAMTILGAIIGADSASKNNTPIVRYATEVVCIDNYVLSQERFIDGYNVTYYYKGAHYTFHTYDRVSIGDRIIIRH